MKYIYLVTSILIISCSSTKMQEQKDDLPKPPTKTKQIKKVTESQPKTSNKQQDSNDSPDEIIEYRGRGGAVKNVHVQNNKIIPAYNLSPRDDNHNNNPNVVSPATWKINF